VSSVAKNTKLDLPTLLADRMEKNQKVGIYTSYDYWLDIGQLADYQKAQNDIKGFI
jgi:NDP-sugar pyrophosphorylase family protein